MVIGVVDCLARVADGQRLGARLAVDIVVGAGHHVEVAHLVDQRAGLGVGAGHRRSPEYLAQVDGVGLGGIDIGIVITPLN